MTVSLRIVVGLLAGLFAWFISFGLWESQDAAQYAETPHTVIIAERVFANLEHGDASYTVYWADIEGKLMHRTFRKGVAVYLDQNPYMAPMVEIYHGYRAPFLWYSEDNESSSARNQRVVIHLGNSRDLSPGTIAYGKGQTSKRADMW